VLQTTAGKMIFGRHIDLTAAPAQQQASVPSSSASGATATGSVDKPNGGEREEGGGFRRTRPVQQA
jgi:hypothetical protein